MLFHQGVSGLVTLQTIRDITNTTEECRGKISEKDVDGEGMLHIGMDDMVRQSVLSTAHGDEDENDIEDVSLLAPLSFILPTPLIMQRNLVSGIVELTIHLDRFRCAQDPVLNPPRRTRETSRQHHSAFVAIGRGSSLPGHH